MRFNHARQAVHDAFATNQTTPDRMEAGGTRYNANSAICHQAEAALIIKAVLEQRKHLRAMCLFLNAPEGWATPSELTSLKARLWIDFLKNTEASSRVQGELVSVIDIVVFNYRRRIQNPSFGDAYTGADVAQLLGRSLDKYDTDVRPHQNAMMEILKRFDLQSLQPVWEVVNEQREKRDMMVGPVAPINPRTGKPYKSFPQKAEAAA